MTWLGKQRIDLEACGSTNDEAARFARAGASHGTIVIAETQTAGRGRDGRVWRSPPGGLYLSAIVRPPISLELVPPMTLAIGIGVCDAIRACRVTGLLKWPNDILVDSPGSAGARSDAERRGESINQRKLAGVLVEAQSQGNRLETVIVGIGLNIAAVAPDHASIATSLEEHGGIHDRETVIEHVCTQVERWIDRYVATGLPSIIEAWQARMAPGIVVRATVDGAPLVGEVAGLDLDGALLVRDGAGMQHRVRSGDAEVIRPSSPGEGEAGPATGVSALGTAC